MERGRGGRWLSVEEELDQATGTSLLACLWTSMIFFRQTVDRALMLDSSNVSRCPPRSMGLPFTQECVTLQADRSTVSTHDVRT